MKTFYLLLLLFPSLVVADYRHHDHNPDTVTNELNLALPMAAAGVRFDPNRYGMQGAIAIGGHDGSQAFAFGLARRMDQVLLSGSVSFVDGNEGWNAGLSWGF
jgi:hypothetical protein